MTAKEYLQQAFILDKLIKAKKSHIQYLRDIQEWVGGTLQEVKVQTSLKKDPVGDVTDDLLDCIEECRQEITRLLDIQRELKGLIEQVPKDSVRFILYERYINFKKWEDIAEIVNYSVVHVHRLHRQGLNELNMLLNVMP